MNRGHAIRRANARLRALVLAATLTAVVVRPSAAAVILYDNTGNPANTYYAAQGGAEAIDDLHLNGAGRIDSLVFEYYDPALGGTITATANVYRNPGALDLDTPLLAGPFVTTPLARGRGRVAIAIPTGLAVDAALWVGIRFSSSTAGVILRDLPSVGSSHDLYFENGGSYWFGGAPKANFAVRLVGTSLALDVHGDMHAKSLELAPALPNPFREAATLRYTVERAGPVRLAVYDVSGRLVQSLVNRVVEAGEHVAIWSGRDGTGRIANAGLYLVRLESGDHIALRKVLFTP